jgi:hypothetical protein
MNADKDNELNSFWYYLCSSVVGVTQLMQLRR